MSYEMPRNVVTDASYFEYCEMHKQKLYLIGDLYLSSNGNLTRCQAQLKGKQLKLSFEDENKTKLIEIHETCVKDIKASSGSYSFTLVDCFGQPECIKVPEFQDLCKWINAIKLSIFEFKYIGIWYTDSLIKPLTTAKLQELAQQQNYSLHETGFFYLKFNGIGHWRLLYVDLNFQLSDGLEKLMHIKIYKDSNMNKMLGYVNSVYSVLTISTNDSISTQCKSYLNGYLKLKNEVLKLETITFMAESASRRDELLHSLNLISNYNENKCEPFAPENFLLNVDLLNEALVTCNVINFGKSHAFDSDNAFKAALLSAEKEKNLSRRVSILFSKNKSYVDTSEQLKSAIELMKRRSAVNLPSAKQIEEATNNLINNMKNKENDIATIKTLKSTHRKKLSNLSNEIDKVLEAEKENSYNKENNKKDSNERLEALRKYLQDETSESESESENVVLKKRQAAISKKKETASIREPEPEAKSDEELPLNHLLKDEGITKLKPRGLTSSPVKLQHVKPLKPSVTSPIKRQSSPTIRKRSISPLYNSQHFNSKPPSPNMMSGYPQMPYGMAPPVDLNMMMIQQQQMQYQMMLMQQQYYNLQMQNMQGGQYNYAGYNNGYEQQRMMGMSRSTSYQNLGPRGMPHNMPRSTSYSNLNPEDSNLNRKYMNLIQGLHRTEYPTNENVYGARSQNAFTSNHFEQYLLECVIVKPGNACKLEKLTKTYFQWYKYNNVRDEDILNVSEIVNLLSVIGYNLNTSNINCPVYDDVDVEWNVI